MSNYKHYKGRASSRDDTSTLFWAFITGLGFGALIVLAAFTNGGTI